MALEPSTSTRPSPPRPTLLMVGRGEPLDLALKLALDRNGLDVEMCGLEELEQAAPRVAADAVLLVGDAAEDGGEWAVHVLSEAPGAESTPVVVLVDDGLESRLRAFRHGALAVVPKTESADQIAKRIAGLADQLATPFQERTGEVGSASFDDLVNLVRSEQRSGILTVHASTQGSPLRVVLGAGRPVAEAVREFVARLQPLVRNPQEPMYYQFHSATGGSVDLVDLLDAPTPRVASRGLVRLRMLIVDDDTKRTEMLAQALRTRGAAALTSDSSGSGLPEAADLDPHIVLIDKTGLEGAGFQVVRVLRNDPRLRWASVMVANWDEIIGTDGRVATVDPLVARIEPMLSAEEELRSRAERETAFDARLEATGPGRLLRILADTGATFHLRIRNQKASIDVDVAQGLVVGAVAKTTVPERRRFQGPAALAALLALTSARVRVERRIKPEIANIMRPVGEALRAATAEPPPFAASSMPPPISVGADSAAESGETVVGDATGPGSDEAEDESGTRSRSGMTPPPVAGAPEPRRSPKPRSMTLMGTAAAASPPPPPPGASTSPVAVATFARPPADPLPPPPMAQAQAIPPAPPVPAAPPVHAASPVHAPPPPPPKGPPPAPPASLRGAELRADEPTARVDTPRDPRARMTDAAHTGWTARQAPSAPVGPPVSLPTAEPVAAAPTTTLRARPSGLRVLAFLSVLGSSMVLAGVVALIGYRYSGMRVQPVDQLLGLVGSPLVVETAAAHPTAPEPADKPSPARPVESAPVASPPAPVAVPAGPTSAAEAAEPIDEPINEARDDAAQPEALPIPANELPSAAEAAEELPRDEAASEEAASEEAAGEEAQVEATPVEEPRAVEPQAEDVPEADADAPPESDASDVDELLAAASDAGRGARAERLYRQVLEREPQEHHAAVGLARILMGRTQYREAVGLMELAVRRRTRRVSYWLLLGEARAGAGDREGGREAWQQALRLDPDNAMARRLLRRR